MGLAEILKGIISSFSFCFLLLAYLTCKLKVKPFLVERQPKKSRPKPLSKEVIDRILELDYQQRLNLKESCDWTNICIKWAFHEILQIPRIRSTIEGIFEEMVQGIRRGSLGCFVKNVELLDLDLGYQPPKMQTVRILTKPATPTEDDMVKFILRLISFYSQKIALAFDFSYCGGLAAIAKIDFIGDWQVFLRVRLCELAGPAYLMIKGTDIFYGLRTMDQVKIRSQLVINGVQFRFINWIVGRLLLVDMLRKKVVFPAMKSHFLIRPEVLQQFLNEFQSTNPKA